MAWNRAAAVVLTDYSKLAPEGRNILRLMFADSRIRAAQEDWVAVARFVVGAFRADVARAGATAQSAALVEELSRLSPEFEALWRSKDVVSHGEGVKRLHHPELGLLELEFSAFAVDGRPDLGMIVYNPATRDAEERMRECIGAASSRCGLPGEASWRPRCAHSGHSSIAANATLPVSS